MDEIEVSPTPRTKVGGVIALGLLLALALTAIGAPGKASDPAGRPNVLVVMTDDQTVADMQVMPRVRRLIGDEGTTFTNSFVNYSLCCPSRATLITGQYAHNHNVRTGSGFTDLDSSNTLPVWLQDAGYHTGHIGKYLGGYGLPDAGGPTRVPQGYDEWYASLPDVLDVYDYRLNQNGAVVHYGSAPEDFKDSVLTDKAVGFIRRNAPSSDPFYLSLGYVAPHASRPADASPSPSNCDDAAVPAPGDEDLFANEPLPMPPSFDERDVSDKPEKIASRPYVHVGGVTRHYRCRLASLIHVDRDVARLVESLGATGELDQTLIIFTSDNGFFNGEHRISTSKIWPYEESIRVPLMMRGPGIPPGQTVDSFAINADLAPTIADATGAVPRRTEDGMSLFRLMSEPSSNRDLLLENYVDAPLYEPFLGLRTTRYLYVKYDNGDRELYDLDADPYELTNRVSDPAYAGPLEWLRFRLDDLDTCSGVSCRASAGQPPAPLGRPSPTGRPVITGTARVGSTLAATPGTWANHPTRFTYQWLRCGLTSCDVEVGADTNHYALTGADAGHKIKVEVTATNATGQATEVSLATPAVVP